MEGLFFLIRLARISTPPRLYVVNGNKGSPIPSGRIGSTQRRRRNISFFLSSVTTEAIFYEDFITFSIGSAFTWLVPAKKAANKPWRAEEGSMGLINPRFLHKEDMSLPKVSQGMINITSFVSCFFVKVI